jgi:hypothetical protein
MSGHYRLALLQIHYERGRREAKSSPGVVVAPTQQRPFHRPGSDRVA